MGRNELTNYTLTTPIHYTSTVQLRFYRGFYSNDFLFPLKQPLSLCISDNLRIRLTRFS